jgi:hypothetical protein
MGFSLSEDGTQFVLWPMPADSYTATLLYRQKITEIEAADIADPTGVTIGELPKRAQKALGLLVASEIAEPTKPEIAAMLRTRYWNDSEPRGVMNQLLDELHKTLAATRSTNRLDHQDGLTNTRRYFGGMHRLTHRRPL